MELKSKKLEVLTEEEVVKIDGGKEKIGVVIGKMEQ